MAEQHAELEHAIGLNGSVPNSLLVLPSHAAVSGFAPATAAEVPIAAGSRGPASVRFVSAVGSCAVVGDVMDPHAQVFLRGHVGALSALALSPTARLLATGERGYDSDVCVWELASGAVLHRFQEHDHGISALAFSDDERLLLSVGAEQDGLVLVWDLSNGAQVTRLRHDPVPVLCAAWGGFVKDIKGRDTALYQFVTGGSKGLSLWALDPITGTQACERVTRPVPTALTRDFLCVAFSPTPEKTWLYGGTASGDVVISHVRSRAVYHSVFCTGGGVTALLALPAPALPGAGARAVDYGGGAGGGPEGVHLFAGGGDGTVTLYHHSVSTLEQDMLLSAAVSASTAAASTATRAPLSARTFVALRAVRVEGAVWSLSPLLPHAHVAAAALPSWAPRAGGGGGGGGGGAGAPLPLEICAATSQGLLFRVTESGGGGAGRSGGGGGAAAPATGGFSATLLRQAHASAGEPLDPSSAPVLALAATPGVASLPPQLLQAGLVGGVWAATLAPGDSQFVTTLGGDNTVRTWSLGDYACVGVTLVRGAGRATCVAHAGEYHVTGWQDGAIRSYYSSPEAAAGEAAAGGGGGGGGRREPAIGGGMRLTASVGRGDVSVVRDSWPDAGSSTVGARGVGGPSGSEDRGFLWSVPEAHAKRGGGVSALAISGNQRFIVTGGVEGHVRIWDMRSRGLVSDFSEHAGAITALKIYRDDAHILSASRDRSFMCWDLRREKRVSSHTQQQGGLNDLCLSRDQSLVITVGQERKIQIWDLREAGPVQTISPAAGESGEALCVASANASDIIASGGSDGVVRFWDLRKSGKAMADCLGHSGVVADIAWTADDKQVVSAGSSDGAVLVWNWFG